MNAPAIKLKKCRMCPERFPQFNSLHVVCSPACAIRMAEENPKALGTLGQRRLKESRRETRQKKLAMKPRNECVKSAQTEFNNFIRERDRGGVCICCDKPLIDSAMGGGYDCGHYRSVGSSPHLRFDERNAHGQAKHCNRYLSGNIVEYRKGLIRKIGLEAVEELEADQSPKHYSRDDLIEIARMYREKTKQLKLKNKIICKVDGCGRPMMYVEQNTCQMHYFRIMRNGNTELRAERRKRLTGISRRPRLENPAGYQKLYLPEHKMANKDGYVYEHRAVVYDLHGDQLPDCELCGKPTSWATCHIDHKDEDVRNNAAENLRPVCRGCNTKRTKRSTAMKLEVDGETLSVMDWAKRDDVNVSHATIKRRLLNGLSPKEAVYGDKATHNGKIPVKPPCPPASTRKNSINATIDGITKTSSEWSREPGCTVTDSTIRNRIRSGWDHRAAVYTPSKFKEQS